MLMSFDFKFIRQDQKQRRNGEACQASFWSGMIDLILKDTEIVFFLSFIISRFLGMKNIKETKSKCFFVQTC